MPKIRKVEMIKLTEEILLDLMKGKDLHVIINGHSVEEKREFIFKGPFDGRFLTNEEITDLKYHAEMGVLNVIDKIKGLSVHNLNSEKDEKNES